MSSKVKFSTRKVDHGGAAFKKAVKELAKGDPHVRVGVFTDAAGGGDAREGGFTNVEIAAVHEFGALEAGIPERSFIRSTFDAHRKEYGAILKKLLFRVIEGKMVVRQMFDIIGAKIVADVNRKVRVEGVPPPLKQATINRKGSSRALIDTGRMLAAVTWVTITDGRKAQ